MTATLTFDLLDKEGMMAHYRCVKSLDMALCIHRINEIMYMDLTDEKKLDGIAQCLIDINLHELID
jgi:hypothetical protein